MTDTPNAPTWPQHPAHKAQEHELNPTSSSLTDSQARQFAEESGTCSDGTQCGTFAETAYCDDCPNRPAPTRQQMIDRCNSTLAFWPSHPEGAQQIMPVDFPWQWLKDNDGHVKLMNPVALSCVTESDWCEGIDLSTPQCLHYGGECGESGYCAPCPNRLQPEYDPEDVAFKQPVNAHYQRTYKGVLFDPYRIAAVWRMQGGPREQIMKKCLRFTDKGQSEQEVVNEIRNALDRWQEMLDEDAAR